MTTALWNVVDLEATCWRGKPPEGEHHEIIEIGICVVDLAAGRRLSKHQIMVRPRTSRVSEFCTELTGHTQEDVDKGVEFADACQALVSEFDARSRPWASWGGYDRRQVNRQCESGEIAYPFGEVHVNAKRAFGALRDVPRGGPGMAKGLEMAGLELEGRHHNGADDAWNAAALVLWLNERDAWPTGPLRKRQLGPKPRSSVQRSGSPALTCTWRCLES